MSDKALTQIHGKAFNIRRARQEDRDRLLWHGEHLRANRQRFLDRQAKGEIVMLLPTLDDEPIGHMAVDMVALRRQGGVYLYWLEVRELYRGQGIGTAVIQRAEEIAKAEGYHFSEIAVGRENEGARRLYERLGYVLIGERKDRWMADRPDGTQIEVIDDNLVLRKTLA